MAASTCVCQGHLREEVGQTVWYERRNQKRLLLEVTSFKETTKKVALIALKLALEPLFFFALEFLLQNDMFNISSSVVFTLE